jgi:hypothetical protein
MKFADRRLFRPLRVTQSPLSLLYRADAGARP